jgi:putative ABC transport system permease protein
MSLVLLIGAALLLLSFARLRAVDIGFPTRNLLTMQIALPRVRYDSQKQRMFFEELLRRVEVLPGVRSATVARTVPMTTRYLTDVAVVEQPTVKRGDRTSAQLQTIAPGYFLTLGISLRRGREFSEHDIPEAPPVVMINESFARRFWPAYPRGQDPIGQHLLAGGGTTAMEIVGIVSDVRQSNLEADAWPELYFPFANSPLQTAALAIRTDGDPMRLVHAIRGQVQAMDQDQTVSGVKTMDELVETSLGRWRLTMLLLGAFAGVALLLAVVGIYGLTAYSVIERKQEIGIRLAMGAQRNDIMRLVLREGLTMVMAGIVIGIVGAFALTRAMKSMLFQVSTEDPVIFAGVALLFILTALAASYLPARRAARIDPMTALRIG